MREWLWKDHASPQEAQIEAAVDYPGGHQPLRHGLSIAEHGGRFEVMDEWIENEHASPDEAEPYFYYRFQRGNPVLRELKSVERRLRRENVKPEESILSQVRDPERYPALAWLQEKYEQMRLFRNWSIGPDSGLRREQSTHDRADFLVDGGQNLPLVLSHWGSQAKAALLATLRELYEGIEDYKLPIVGGNVQLVLIERGGREIPATRLSDGTLRYLCLLAILLHPDPPPLVAIEEPELGLHNEALRGLSVPELQGQVNLSQGRIKKTIDLLALEAPAPIAKQGTKWQLTAASLSEAFWQRAARLTDLRYEEQRQMQEYVHLTSGHMAFLINALDGNPSSVQKPTLPPLPTRPPQALIRDAVAYLRRVSLPIAPRLLWPAGGLSHYGLRGRIPPELQAQPGGDSYTFFKACGPGS